MRRTWIDFDLATSPLSDNAFRVMVYLLLHANKDGDCWPNLATIATETNRSQRSLDFAIRELKDRKLLQSFNEGRGRYRFQILLRTSATDCARKPKEQAQQAALENDRTSATDCARSEGTSAKSEVNERKICSERAQKVNPPLTTPYICEQGIEQGIEQPHAPTPAHAREGQPLRSGSGSGGSGYACPAKAKAEELIGNAGMDIENQRLITSVVSLLEAGKKENEIAESLLGVKEFEKGEHIKNYYTFMSKGMGRRRAPAGTPDEKPKRITSKDGKRVLIDGEWVDAAKPYENMPAAPIHDKLGDAYDGYLFQIQGMPLESPKLVESMVSLGELFDKAQAKKLSEIEFHRLAKNLIDTLKGGAA